MVCLLMQIYLYTSLYSMNLHETQGKVDCFAAALVNQTVAVIMSGLTFEVIGEFRWEALGLASRI